MRTQHAFGEFTHHGEPERIGAPARLLDGFVEFRLGEQHLGIMPGAGAGIFVDRLLHQEGRILVDEIRELTGIADRIPAAEDIE